MASCRVVAGQRVCRGLQAAGDREVRRGQVPPGPRPVERREPRSGIQAIPHQVPAEAGLPREEGRLLIVEAAKRSVGDLGEAEPGRAEGASAPT